MRLGVDVMRVSIKPLLLNLLLSLMLVVEAWATPLQSLDSIEQAAYVYAMEHVQTHYDMPRIVVGSLDSRLRLQQCEHELEAFTAQNKVGLGNQTIGVKCDSSIPWSVYVPVIVKLFKPVVVTTKAMAAKHIITSTDVMLKRIDVASLRQGYLTDTKLLIGQQLKYAVSMGSALSQNKVKPEKIVRRGDLITLLAEVGEMEVRMNGTALSDASMGQRIQVKNSSSKRVVEGIVDAPGIVRVSM
jgi:flagella basal body P-ring formation protein FlgA